MELTTKINNFDIPTLAEYADQMFHSSCHDMIDVAELTEICKNDFLGWVRSGIILNAIRENFKFVLRQKLATSWKKYCLNFFGKTHWYVKRIIEASKVILILIKNGFDVIPTNENQARHLTRLLPDPEQMNAEECAELEQEICQQWALVLKRAKGAIITGDLVKSVVDPESQDKPKKNIKLKGETHDKLLKQALDKGFKDVAEYLEAIANNEISLDNSVEEIEEEKLAQWQEDLELLLEEAEQELDDLEQQEWDEIFEEHFIQNPDPDLHVHYGFSRGGYARIVPPGIFRT